MPRKRRVNAKESEHEEGDEGVPLSKRRRQTETHEETLVISGSDSEAEGNKVVARRVRMTERESEGHSQELTEEEMMDLAMKLSKQEASYAALQQEEEDEAMRRAIEESLHVNGTQAISNNSESALLLSPTQWSSSHDISSPPDNSPVFPAHVKSTRDPDAGTSGASKKNTHMHPEKPEAPEKEVALLIPKATEALATASQAFSSQTKPSIPSPSQEPVLCIPKLSPELLQDCRTSGFLLCSQENSLQLISSSQQLLPSPPQSPVFSTSDYKQLGKRTKPALRCQGPESESESTSNFRERPKSVRNLRSHTSYLSPKTSLGLEHVAAKKVVGYEEEHCIERNLQPQTKAEALQTEKEPSDQCYETQMDLRWSEEEEEEEEDIHKKDTASPKTVRSPVFPREPPRFKSPPNTPSCLTSEGSPSPLSDISRLRKFTFPYAGKPVVQMQKAQSGRESPCEGSVRYYWGVPFCPRGLNPNEYTRVILSQLEVYEKSLKEARRELLHKAEWGSPVLPDFSKVRKGRVKRHRAARPLAVEEEEGEEEKNDKRGEVEEEARKVSEKESEGSPRGSRANKANDQERKNSTVLPSSQAQDEDEEENSSLLFSQEDMHEKITLLRRRSPVEMETREQEEELRQGADMEDGNMEQMELGLEKDAPEESRPESEEVMVDEEELQNGRLASPMQTEDAELMLCPLCLCPFTLARIERHAAYCDGSQEVCTQGIGLRKRSRKPELTDENKPGTSSSAKNTQREKCYLCQGVFSIREYGQHVENCIHNSRKNRKSGKSLLTALDQSEQRDSDSDSFSKKMDYSPSFVEGGEPEGKDEFPNTFQISDSPIKAFTPISELTDCLIDFRQSHSAKPSQRSGKRKRSRR